MQYETNNNLYYLHRNRVILIDCLCCTRNSSMVYGLVILHSNNEFLKNY